MIAFIGLQSHLVDGAEALLTEDLDLVGVDDLGGGSRVNTRGFDSNNEVSAVLDEHASVEAENTGLIGLGDISEDHVAHRHEHAVLLGVTSVLNNRDDIGTLLSHVDKVTADTLRELDSVDGTLGSDQVRHVGDGSARGSTDVQNLAARLDVDVVTSTADASGQLGSEGVPGTVLSLLAIDLLK